MISDEIDDWIRMAPYRSIVGAALTELKEINERVSELESRGKEEAYSISAQIVYGMCFGMVGSGVRDYIIDELLTRAEEERKSRYTV